MSRQFIYCREVNPSSFVMLYVKGETGSSWSIRDYSKPGSVSVRYAREFSYPLADLLSRSVCFPAPSTSSADLGFWHAATQELNTLHLSTEVVGAPATPVAAQDAADFYPILNHEELLSLPKAAKTTDMRRIYKSPNSEDWVTWNMFALIQRNSPDKWWPSLVTLARDQNPSLELPGGWQQTPSVSLWQIFSPPAAYQDASRLRMAGSTHEPSVLRAKSVAPVEGESEIDISLRNNVLTVFIEAKLGSDISLKTTHDPARNQIARNIDCLLEACGRTTPMFWMLVRDRGSMRAYTQLIKRYREDSSALSSDLPHRDPSTLKAVALNLAIVLWSDLLRVCCETKLESPYQEVLVELMRRVSFP